MLEAKKSTLSKLNKKSVESIAQVQTAVNQLIALNDDIDKTAHEIEEIESNFSLIKGELESRKKNNSVLINQIKRVMDK